jgi:hypothetical protein
MSTREELAVRTASFGHRRLATVCGIAFAMVVPAIIMAAVPNTFKAGDVISSSQVNANFASLDQGLLALESRIVALEAKRTLAFAHVNANGTIDSDSGNITVVKVDAGLYCAAVTGATPRVAVASLDGRINVGGSVQASVIAASGCPSGAQQIFIVTRPQNQDGGFPGQDRAFYLLVN